MKIKNGILSILTAGVLGFGMSLTAQAEEDGVSVSGDIGVFSQYVWRGVPQNGNKTAVQGDVGLAYEGLSAGAWFSNSYSVGTRDVVEFDFTLDYSGSIGDSGLGYSVGGIYYTYMYDSKSNFPELYVGLSYDAPVSPFVTAYFTVADSSNKFYKSGDIWVDFGLTGSLAGFDLSGTLSYVKFKKDPVNRPIVGGIDMWKSGLSMAALGASKDFAVGDLTVTPSLTTTFPLIKKQADGFRYVYGAGLNTAEFVAGVNIGY